MWRAPSRRRAARPHCRSHATSTCVGCRRNTPRRCTTRTWRSPRLTLPASCRGPRTKRRFTSCARSAARRGRRGGSCAERSASRAVRVRGASTCCPPRPPSHQRASPPP
eukprot:1613078-Prymnesium_polylepis.1